MSDAGSEPEEVLLAQGGGITDLLSGNRRDLSSVQQDMRLKVSHETRLGRLDRDQLESGWKCRVTVYFGSDIR